MWLGNAVTSSNLLADPPSNETIDVFYIKMVTATTLYCTYIVNCSSAQNPFLRFKSGCLAFLNAKRDRHAVVTLEHGVEVLAETTDLLLYTGESEMCCTDQFLTTAQTKLCCVLRYSVARHGYKCTRYIHCRTTCQLLTET